MQTLVHLTFSQSFLKMHSFKKNIVFSFWCSDGVLSILSFRFLIYSSVSSTPMLIPSNVFFIPLLSSSLPIDSFLYFLFVDILILLHVISQHVISFFSWIQFALLGLLPWTLSGKLLVFFSGYHNGGRGTKECSLALLTLEREVLCLLSRFCWVSKLIFFTYSVCSLWTTIF